MDVMQLLMRFAVDIYAMIITQVVRCFDQCRVPVTFDIPTHLNCRLVYRRR